MGEKIEDETQSSDNGEESAAELRKDRDENVLKFLDSMDDYVTLMDALSSTLRQGWLELASARYSMGGSRINSALFDHKDHSASTTLMIDDSQEPPFSLCKWASPCKSSSSAAKFPEDELSFGKYINSPDQSSSLSSHDDNQEDKQESNGSPHAINDTVQKERLKSLSVFGTLVSPKLRAAQLSFETALDTLVEIANARSSMLSAYDLVHKDSQSTKK